jgi:hypothetical protein
VANAIPDNPDALLSRQEAAEALTASGFPIRGATLARKACRHEDGPPYRHFGKFPRYRWGDCLAWAQSRLSSPRGGQAKAAA